jgi:hypothetical protein
MIGCAVALASVAVAAAQQSAAKSDHSEHVTVTGCLTRGGTSAATTSGTSTGAATTTAGSATTTAGANRTGAAATSGVSANESQFMLTKAGPAQTGPAGTLSSNLPAQAASRARSYRLQGDESKLASHVNHQVEITGELQDSVSKAPTTEAGRAPANTTAAQKEAASTAPPLLLNVDSVKELSSKCSE